MMHGSQSNEPAKTSSDHQENHSGSKGASAQAQEKAHPTGSDSGSDPGAFAHFSDDDSALEEVSALPVFKELEEAKAKIVETHDRMLRIAAEFDNARKRWEKEREDIRKYAISEFARELLPVIDSFDKAMTLIENVEINSNTEEGKNMSSIVEGVQIVSKVFHESIKKHGIERVPGKGEVFNPEYHNAIAKQVDPEVSSDTVVEEFVSGYKIGDRVLRTAMVKVATKD